MLDDLVNQSIDLPSGPLDMLQPQVSAELPDIEGVEWAPVAPYWSIVWRSGVALARRVDRTPVRGLRIVELGCGMAVPSITAARGGATVLATDICSEAVTLAARNARANEAPIETATVNWAEPKGLVDRAPFDLVLAADVLYDRASVAVLLSLLPRLAKEAWIADPGRSATDAFMEQASRRWRLDTEADGVVQIHRLRFESTVD